MSTPAVLVQRQVTLENGYTGTVSLSPEHGEKSIAQPQPQRQKHDGTTMVARWAHAFSEALQPAGTIHVEKLLDAVTIMYEDIFASGHGALTAREFRKNVQKSRAYCKKHPKDCPTSMEELLAAELATNIHTQRPNHNHHHLNESSSAMGLLWIRRSLEFQAEIFHHLSLPSKTSMNAGLLGITAYSDSLRKHHSWALQHVYSLGLKMAGATSSTQAWLASYGGHFDQNKAVHQERLEHIQSDMRALLKVWKPLLDQWAIVFENLHLEDPRRA